MEFNRLIKEMRQAHGMTQSQLANKLDLSTSTIKGWEAENKQTNFETLCKLAKLFGVTVGQLLGTEEY